MKTKIRWWRFVAVRFKRLPKCPRDPGEFEKRFWAKAGRKDWP